MTIGFKWKKCAHEHSVFVNDWIVLKQKYLHDHKVIVLIINQKSNKNNETSKRILDYINTVCKSAQSVEYLFCLDFVKYTNIPNNTH